MTNFFLSGESTICVSSSAVLVKAFTDNLKVLNKSWVAASAECAKNTSLFPFLSEIKIKVESFSQAMSWSLAGFLVI